MRAPGTYYQATAATANQAPLQGTQEVRVCVVGGGFAGLNTALGLAERGVRDITLLEAHQPGFGASGRNGGFIFGGFSRGEDRLLADLGLVRAKALYRGTTDAVSLIRERVQRYRIDCELMEGGVVWANWFRDQNILRERQRLLRESFDTDWQWLGREQMQAHVRTDRYHEGLFEPSAMHFHPLKYAQGIASAAGAAGVRIHGASPATSLRRDGAGWRVSTPQGEVRAQTVVLSCGGYLAGLHPKVDAGVLPIATYVMVTEPLGPRLPELLPTAAAVYDTRFAFDYYRALPDSRLLWGGRISIRDRSPQDVIRLLRRDLDKVFPDLADVRVEHAWSGLMGYARHEMPQIGEIEPGLWLAQAFGGHGVAPTTFGGELVASAIAQGDQRWHELSGYGLVSTLKPAGFLGAQLSYSWLQFKDAWKDWTERML